MHEMIDRILLKDYRKRPSIDEILNSPSMQDKMKLYGYTSVRSEELKVRKPSAITPTVAPGIKPYAK
jgi:hypothetical protein